LPQNILVTQQITANTGGTRFGVVCFSNAVVGTSPDTIYRKSNVTSEGLYATAGVSNQVGYTVLVTPGSGGGNNPPVANPQSVSLLEDTNAPITLTATDSDFDPLTYSVVTGPTNGTLSGTPPNVVYQPNLHYIGADSFTFVANDGTADSTPAQVSITVNPPSAGLIINPIFDSSITGDPNATAIMNGINAAIQVYEAHYSDPVTVNIVFQTMPSGLGMSATFGGNTSYSSFLNALTSDSRTGNDPVALAHIPGGANNPVDGTASIRLTTANFRALGFNANPPPGSPDSTISLNVSLMNLDRSSIDPSKYDLIAVASHEIDEALGTSSGAGGGTVRPVDLFRYSSGGTRNFTTAGDDAYFSIDGGSTDLARYNQDPGGDYGDWWSAFGGQTPQVQDAFATPGATPDLGVEFTVLDVIGWNFVQPAGAPRFRSVSRTGNTINFSWDSVATRTYQVQYVSDVSATIWTNLGGPITAVSSTTSSSDTISAVSGAKRFYRVALLPPPSATQPPPPPGPTMATGSVSQTPISGLSLTTNYFLPSRSVPATPQNNFPTIRVTPKFIKPLPASFKESSSTLAKP
jgi:hypothetical protein